MLTFAQETPEQRGPAQAPAMVGLLAHPDKPTPSQLSAAKRRGDTDFAGDFTRMKYDDFAKDRWALRKREQLYGEWEVKVKDGRWRLKYEGAAPPYKEGRTHLEEKPLEIEGTELFVMKPGKGSSRDFGYEPEVNGNFEREPDRLGG